MKNLVLILPQKEKGIFTPPIKYELSGDYIKMWMKDNSRALKKGVEIIGENKAVISKDAVNMKILGHFIEKYKSCFNEELFFLTKKCVEELIKQKNAKLPFYEIFVFAIPDIAVKIIQELRNYARIFTVVYNGEFDNGIFDGLYFKYGIITRHLSKIKCNEKENSLFISTDFTDYIPPKTHYPVISLADKRERDDAIMVKEVALNIKGNSFIENSGLVPSVFMLNLLNIEMNDNITADITKKADEIFMLDITRF